MSRAILVLGATGKQGGGTLKALLAHPSFSSEKYTIYAATRKPDSPSAKRLAALSPSVKPVVGDLRNPVAMFDQLPTKPWAVFAITYPGKTETTDGINTIDAAIKAGVSHVVFSSVDRGENSPATNVPHFITKHNIEEHLRQKASESNGSFSYTIIRPPFFLDNLEPGFFGKVFTTLWKNHVDSNKAMTVVDTSDVGNYAAAAILEYDSDTYRNAEFNVAGDAVTFEQANTIFKEKVGHDIPTTYSIFPRLLMYFMPDMARMTEFFNKPGFAASPAESNKLHHMATFKEWVDRSSHVSNKSR
jgi:uncharacterized protein YbjT (DUF2867 family)